MPNWVYNVVSISAKSTEELNKFKEHISIIPEFYESGDDEDGVPKVTMGENEFSFHSFITLDKEHKEEYHTTNGSGPDGRTGDTPFNWYNWNNSNWHTKWDACEVDMELEEHSVTIRFSTAWAPPEPVFVAMSAQFPELTFEVYWEEEQGFGGELTLEAGDIVGVPKSWDIPSSHQDYLDRDNEDSCLCSHYEDQEQWFDDCPGKEPNKVHIIEVVHRFEVRALNESDAIEAVKAHEDNFDIKSGIEIVSYEYNADYRHVGHKEQPEEES
jgi:hypothetical protein